MIAKHQQATSNDVRWTIQQVLALCARPTPVENSADRLAGLLDGFSAWHQLVAAGETHGLGPLLYAHCQAARIEVPAAAGYELRGLYLRHRQASKLQMQALAQILGALRSAGIRALILKGAALAHLIYPEPGLRPMGDIDLLIDGQQLAPARQVLARLGYPALAGSGSEIPTRHVVVEGSIQGLAIRIELHHRLFPRSPSRREETPLLEASANSVNIGQATAHTLPHEAMLGHLCQHLVSHADVFRPFRLIWVADIIGYVEAFAAHVDWSRLSHDYPVVPNVLSLIGAITPEAGGNTNVRGMSRPFVAKSTPSQPFRIPNQSDPLAGWADFSGWPRTSIAEQRRHGKPWEAIVLATLCPPAWWLRLHYGRGANSSLLWCRWARFPAEVLGWVGQLAGERVGNARGGRRHGSR